MDVRGDEPRSPHADNGSHLDFYERTLILDAPRRVVHTALETAVRERTRRDRVDSEGRMAARLNAAKVASVSVCIRKS